MRHFDREVVVTRWTPKDVKDAAVERVVAGDVKFRFVIDTATFDD